MTCSMTLGVSVRARLMRRAALSLVMISDTPALTLKSKIQEGLALERRAAATL